MIDNLPLFHRIASTPVVVLGQGEAADAKRRLVERAGGRVVADLQRGIDAGARIAFVAHEDGAAAVADAEQARSAGLLVNVVDRPALCDFTVPSLLDRSPVLIAIGTGGASAGLAKQVRLRLEQILPVGLGRLARALFEARGALRARFPDAGERRRALDVALSTGGALDCLAGRDPDAEGQAVATWLAHAGDAPPELVEIRLRSDDPEDLTLREARLLGSADLLLHEPCVPATILDRARADACRVEIAAGMEVSDRDHAAGNGQAIAVTDTGHRARVVLRGSRPVD